MTETESATNRRPLAVVLVLVAVLIATAATPTNAQTREDVERAEHALDDAHTSRDEIQQELQETISVQQQVTSQRIATDERITRLETRVAAAQNELDTLHRDAEKLIRNAYVGGGASTLIALIDATSLQEIASIQAVLSRASDTKVESLRRLTAIDRQLQRLTTELLSDREELAGLEADAAASRDRIDQLFYAAEIQYTASQTDLETERSEYAAEEHRIADEKRRRAEEERRRAERQRRDQEEGHDEQGGNRVGGLVCPSSAPLSFINDWGFPRSGGRTHKGTDVFASYGADVYAVTDGVVRAREGGPGGIAVWLNGDDGNAYYYAHLSGWAGGIVTGKRVKKGQLVGYVGDSGNAKGTSPHTHFQIHPRGGTPVNPYPTLTAICDR